MKHLVTCMMMQKVTDKRKQEKLEKTMFNLTRITDFFLKVAQKELILKKSRQVGTALLYIRGITYEELSSILIKPKKFYRHFKNIFLEKLKISVLKKIQNILKIKSIIHDLYFLNNNKYLKSFGINRCRYAISYEHKNFYDFSTSKLLANFRVFDRFPTTKTTHKEPFYTFLPFYNINVTTKKNKEVSQLVNGIIEFYYCVIYTMLHFLDSERSDE
ncbi:hypothetical protein AGLY_001861 [Aphis glycines]|uniref:Uncharacterized protein n=1 Tax=Aphis glycines TaxID=307491 RepID=A0A6G0U4L4_APHGL|nr:hypothetical protein AGLY_001861 [Aphis glycines]